MNLYTKTGDSGETGLWGGTRVPKHDPRVYAYGDVDETNAVIGWALAGCRDDEWLCDVLGSIQSDLFDLGAQLATPADVKPKSAVSAERVAQLEKWIDEACAQVDPLEHFILPGGGEKAARLHVARTVSRRAERRIVGLAEHEPVSAHCLEYFNRLSDLLFAAARRANKRDGIPDVEWQPKSATD